MSPFANASYAPCTSPTLSVMVPPLVSGDFSAPVVPPQSGLPSRWTIADALLRRLIHFLRGHKNRCLGAHGTAGGHRQRHRGCTHVVWGISDCENVSVAEGEIEGFEP